MNESCVELSNIEIFQHCILNRKTGKKVFNSKRKKTAVFSGNYYLHNKIFFALYPTENGPIMFYENKEYELNKNLHITLKKNGRLERI